MTFRCDHQSRSQYPNGSSSHHDAGRPRPHHRYQGHRQPSWSKRVPMLSPPSPMRKSTQGRFEHRALPITPLAIPMRSLNNLLSQCNQPHKRALVLRRLVDALQNDHRSGQAANEIAIGFSSAPMASNGTYRSAGRTRDANGQLEAAPRSGKYAWFIGYTEDQHPLLCPNSLVSRLPHRLSVITDRAALKWTATTSTSCISIINPIAGSHMTDRCRHSAGPLKFNSKISLPWLKTYELAVV